MVDRDSRLMLLDQTVAATSDFLLINHPFSILRLQCQANSHAMNRNINPLQCLKLFGSQMSQHGIFATFAKALQTTCAHTTVEGVVKKIIIEALSEISGVDLNMTNSVHIDSFKAVKYGLLEQIIKCF